jgi:CelD/BcsL family acetyltransferase involved in cellulose biosynthesis
MGGDQADYMGPIIDKNYNINNDFSNIWEKCNKALPRYDFMLLNNQKAYLFNVNNPFVSNFNNFKSLKAYKSILHNDWESFYEKHANSKSRQTDRRKIRKLKEMGELSFKIGKSKTEKEKIIKSMIQQKRERYKQTNVIDWLSIKEFQKFYIKLAQLNMYKTEVHCSSFILNNEAIACHVGVIHEDTFYLLMISHENEEFRSFSPGRLFMLELINHSFKRGLKYFDFTIGEENYKKSWSDEESIVYSSFKSVTILGRLYQYIFIIKKNIMKNKIIGPKLKVLKIFFLNKFVQRKKH